MKRFIHGFCMSHYANADEQVVLHAHLNARPAQVRGGHLGACLHIKPKHFTSACVRGVLCLPFGLRDMVGRIR
jgi:hypothetical protein